MTRVIGFVSGMLLVVLMLAACQPIQATVSEAAPAATPMPTGVPSPTATFAPIANAEIELRAEKITSQALAGNLLGDPAERTVYVLLPPSYSEGDKRYPVVYVMPWARGAPSENAYGFSAVMESFLRKGEIPEMLIVVPDGQTRLGASHFRSSPVIGDYETYVTQEVVNYVDTHYRTLATHDSRGLAGCSNGGSAAMRLGLMYPDIFSVVVSSDGIYDESLDVWPSDVESLHQLTELPQDIRNLDIMGLTGWYIQLAAAHAPAPGNPPFYCEAPFRIVNGYGEFVPEVIDKIVEHDAAHEARRYMQQPVRLQGILIQKALYDDADLATAMDSFGKLLTEFDIEYAYEEVAAGHCSHRWEAASLQFMADHLVFQEP